jgi:malate synthase
MLQAAKAKMSRARRELERKRFEVEATQSERLARIDDWYGSDAEDADGWVGTIHGQGLEVDEVPVGSGPEFASGIVSTLEVCGASVVPGFGDIKMKT